ncbi:MAG: hypothetical protein HZA24_00290 [Nitrospirae bacterium]|nr:hypothetical protein [Nitrospirota bacterium]
MHHLTRIAAGLAVAGCITHAPAAWAQAPEAFSRYGCDGCHTVSAYGIGTAPTADAGGPPDLSDVGTRRDAAFIQGFLKKQVALDGRKHMLRFPGSDAELSALAGWLVTLDRPPAPAP